MVTGWTSIIDLVSTGDDVSANLDTAFGNIESWSTGIEDGSTTIDKLKLNPALAAIPTYTSGNTFIDPEEGLLAFYTDVPGFMVHAGVDSVVRVVNRTGSIIPAGKAIRNGGIDAVTGRIKAEYAQSNSLVTSFVIGFTAAEIGIDEEGFIISEGHLHDVDTSGLVLGGTLFLSSTVPGGVVQTQQDIACTLGTVQVVDATAGRIFVKIDNLIAYPQVTGYLRELASPIYSLTTSPQDITGYNLSEDIITIADPVNGTLSIPLSGLYFISFTAITSFTSLTSTRTVYFELYNVTTATVEGTYPRNIPRDATEEGISFTAPFKPTTGDVYKMRVRASTAMNLTFDNIAFMLTSNHLG